MCFMFYLHHYGPQVSFFWKQNHNFRNFAFRGSSFITCFYNYQTYKLPPLWFHIDFSHRTGCIWMDQCMLVTWHPGFNSRQPSEFKLQLMNIFITFLICCFACNVSFPIALPLVSVNLVALQSYRGLLGSNLLLQNVLRECSDT